MPDITSSSTERDEVHPWCLYQYGSLEDKPPRTIRLLKIDHDCGNGPINHVRSRGDHCDSDLCNSRCCDKFNARMPELSLHEACLDTAPIYEAISYAWGSPALVQQVVCDSKVLRVTQSCYDLLRKLRQRSSSLCYGGFCSLQAHYYWIDAICINQGFQERDTLGERSQRERSHQVAMMATIYEKAIEVVVWPGHVDNEDGLSRAMNNALGDVLKIQVPGLRSLIQQPYFTRIWPLQEIALARSCIMLIDAMHIVDISSALLMPYSESRRRRQFSTVFAGEYRWAVFNDAENGRRGDPRDDPEVTSARLEYERVTTLHRRLLGFFKSSLNNSNADPRLSTSFLSSEVLLHARDHQASEPRDKVFALYGILQRLGAYLEAPNYLRPIEDIYLEASVVAIRTDRSLRVLEGLTGESNFNLPSWSPDWSDHQHITNVAEWTDHKASGSSETQFSISGSELVTYGLIVDIVRQEHIAFAATSFLVEADTLAESLIEPLRDPSNVPTELYLDLLEKMFLNIWGKSYIRNPRDYAHREWVQNDAEKRTDKRTVCRLIGYRYDKEPTEAVIKRSALLHANLCRRLDRKTLFQTRDGRLGIASRNIKTGDSIVLLQGCNLPMVVRAERNEWKLVAPAYITADGIMDGKLWKSNGSLQSFSFT